MYDFVFGVGYLCRNCGIAYTAGTAKQFTKTKFHFLLNVIDCVFYLGYALCVAVSRITQFRNVVVAIESASRPFIKQAWAVIVRSKSEYQAHCLRLDEERRQ